MYSIIWSLSAETVLHYTVFCLSLSFLFILFNPGFTEGHVSFCVHCINSECIYCLSVCICTLSPYTLCVFYGCGLMYSYSTYEFVFLHEIQPLCSEVLSSVIVRLCSLHTPLCPLLNYSSIWVKQQTSIIHSASLVSSYPCSYYSAVKPEGSAALGSSVLL